MIDEVRALLDEYQAWLRDKTILRQMDDWVEITTPYLDRHNDCLQIYAIRDGGGWVLSDDGFIIGDLENSGCMLNTPKRESLLNVTLAGFGVRRERGNVLTVRASHSDFSLKKHSLVQAMLAVNDLFYLSSSSVSSFFTEDVQAWLDASSIRYTPKVKFPGASGYDHLFDFVIPKSGEQPERMIRTINSPDRQTATTVAFSCLDTQSARPEGSDMYAILNDSQANIPPAVVDALGSYGVISVKWAERERVRDQLAA